MSENLRVVIVDDTPDMRLLVRLSLELDPHIEVVAEGGDGRAAIELAEQHQPDVLLLDLAMPVMDGMQALPRVVRASPRTTVLVLSGFAASAMADEAVAAGAHGYLQKGIGAEELCEQVWAATGRERPRQPLEAIFALPVEPSEPSEPAEPAAPRSDVASRAAESAPGGIAVRADHARGPASGWLLLYLNREARTLLGLPEDHIGESVGHLVPGLARVLDELTAGGEGRVGRLETDAGGLRVRARRAAEEVVVSLEPEPHSDLAADRLRAAIARTAHELRTPVTVLVGLCDALQAADGQLSEEQRTSMRAALRRQADVLERITSDLETATLAQRGSLSVEVEPVDVGAVVRSCLTAGPHENPVQVYAEEHVTALADPARLTQVVTNLLSNARKYADPPYEVHVRRVDEQVHLTVADRGDGVPEDFRPLLFEEFTRAGSDARGTGLGLFVVRSLCAALGGAVDYQPRPGGGSLFTVRLPAGTM